MARRGDGENAARPTTGRLLRRARHRRGWTQARLAYEIREVARKRGWPAPKAESLVVSISRWESGRRHPDHYNLALLLAALGLSPSDLGIRGQ
jgi:transcriptional regulator with XRE-family HTH domain